MNFALMELSELYPPEEIKAMVFWLFEDFLGVERAHYYLNLNKGMSESEMLQFNFAIKDLKQGKPVQHILGYTWFLGLKFWVNEHTLIPRPETEELVQHIISHEKENPSLKILDIGTGTACIPIGLAHAMPQHEYTGIDFKEEILELAKKNAEYSTFDIHLIQMDILKDSTEQLPIFDVIISNPPYVLESEKAQMHENVVQHEPASALYVDNKDPLIFYHQISELALEHLQAGGRLYFEINENFGEPIVRLLSKMKFKNIKILKDFRDRNRFVICEK